jgi:hypothetical protein
MKKIKLLTLKARNSFLAMAFILSLTLLSTIATAQNRWDISITPAANFSTKNLGNAKLKTGFGADATIAYRLTKQLGIYGGWGWNKFSSAQSFAGTDMEFVETGYSVGLQFTQLIASSKMKFILGAGAIYKHIETENSKGDLVNDTGHGWGWEAKTGISFPLGKHFNFIPTIKYSALSRNIQILTTTTPVGLNYLSVGAGFNWTF